MPITIPDPKSGPFDFFKGIWASTFGAKPQQIVNLTRSPTIQSLPIIGPLAKEAEQAVNRNIGSEQMAKFQEWATPPPTGEGGRGAAMGEAAEALIPFLPGKANVLNKLAKYVTAAKEGAPLVAFLTRPIAGAVAGGTRAAVEEVSRGREEGMGLPVALGAVGGAVGGLGTAARDYGVGKHPIEAGPFDPRYQWFKGIQGSRNKSRDFPFTSPEDYERLTKAASRYGQKFTVGGFEKLKGMYGKLQDALQDATERTSLHASELVNKYGVKADQLKTNARQEVLSALEELKRNNPGHEAKINEYVKKNNSLAGISDDMSLMGVNKLRSDHTSFYPGHISKSPDMQDVWMNQAISNAIYEGARRAQSKYGYKVQAATKGTPLQGKTPWLVDTEIPGRGKLMLDDAAREARDLQDLKSLAEIGSTMQRNVVSVGGSKLPLVGRFFGDPSLPIDPATRSKVALLQEFAKGSKVVPSPERLSKVPYAAAAGLTESPGATSLPPSEWDDLNPLDYIPVKKNKTNGAVKNLFNIQATPEGGEAWDGEIPQRKELRDVVDKDGNVIGQEEVFKPAVFKDQTYGARATAKLLQKYQQKDNLNTLYEIFGKYAPLGHGSNDPVIYAENVSRWLGINPDDKINTNDPEFMKKLLSAIVQQEHSRKPSSEEMKQISSGVEKALGTAEPPTTDSGTK